MSHLSVYWPSCHTHIFKKYYLHFKLIRDSHEKQNIKHRITFMIYFLCCPYHYHIIGFLPLASNILRAMLVLDKDVELFFAWYCDGYVFFMIFQKRVTKEAVRWSSIYSNNNNIHENCLNIRAAKLRIHNKHPLG